MFVNVNVIIRPFCIASASVMKMHTPHFLAVFADLSVMNSKLLFTEQKVKSVKRSTAIAELVVVWSLCSVQV